MNERDRTKNQANTWGFLILAAGLLAAILLSQEQAASRQLAAASQPLLSPVPGHYPHGLTLSMTPPEPGLPIIYTLDGRSPTPEYSFIYQQPIPLQSADRSVIIVRAAAQYPDGQLGPLHTATYFLGPLPGIPIISLVIEPENLWSQEQGIYVNPDGRGAEWERPIQFTYLDESGMIQADLAAGVRIHGNASRYDAKKSWRLYFRQEYGRSRLDLSLFPDSPVTSFKRLVLHAGGQETSEQAANWTLLRNALAYQLGREMGGVAPYTRPVLLTINGELWGIYQLTERIDAHYFADHLGISEYDWLDTPEMVFVQEEDAAARQHWDQFMALAESFDPQQPDQYAQIAAQIDVPNLIDYVAFQIYFANKDWPRNNVLQFRPRTQGGQWQWVLWDFEYGFGHIRHSPVDTNMVAAALTEEHARVTGRFSMLLRKLLENAQFQEAFLTRTADLLNTTLAATAVTRQIDTLAAPLEPVIQYESARWAPLSAEEWATHVAELRRFAEERPFYVRQHLADYFGRNIQTLTITLPPAAEGTIWLNGLPLTGEVEHSHWEGFYFEGNKVQVTAVPAPGYAFVSWGSPDSTQTEMMVPMETAVNLTPSFTRISAP